MNIQPPATPPANIAFIDLAAQRKHIGERMNAAIQKAVEGGAYIMGPQVKQLEDALSDFCGARHTITCANGTDALSLALMALGVGEGDAVFVPSFTFAATAEVVPGTGATPVFVDVDERTFNMDGESLKRAIEHSRTLGLKPAGVIPVDLFGLPADYDAIETIAGDHDLWVIGDTAQGFGAQYKGRTTGSLCRVTTTSFFPAKPLGCYGDGGAVFTEDDDVAALLRSLRFHGKGDHKYDNVRIGMNSRLDTIQAAVLLEKLAIYSEELEKREAVARRYNDALRDVVDVPYVPENTSKSVWAQYTVKLAEGTDRDALQGALKERGVPTAVYYPLPLHMQTAYSEYPCAPDGLKTSQMLSKCVLSLPMHPYLDAATQDHIVATLRELVTGS